MNFREETIMLVSRNPFFAELLMNLEKVEDKNIATIGGGVTTTGVVLYYNEDFMQKMGVKNRVAVIEHELMHVVNLHMLRVEDRDFGLFNVAADVAINQDINDLPNGAFYNTTFGLPAQRTTEFYYDKLKKESNKIKAGIIKAIKNGEGKIGSHEKWKSAGVSESLARKIVNDVLKKAFAETTKTYGNVSSDIDRLLKDALAPPINWKTLLHSIVSSSKSPEIVNTIKRKNRRMSWARGTRKVERLKILVGIDTSGSIDDVLLDKFSRQVYDINKFGNELWIAVCDCSLKSFYSLGKNKKLKRLLGGGGTSFIPVFDKAKKLRPDVVVYFTDGCGEFPESSRFKTLWCLSEDVSVPFGKSVLLK